MDDISVSLSDDDGMMKRVSMKPAAAGSFCNQPLPMSFRATARS